MGNNINKLIILFFALATLHFFGFIKISPQLSIYIFDAALLGAVVYILFNYKSSYNNKFTFPILLLLMAIIMSSMSCYIFWGQDFITTIKAVTFLMSYVLYFLLSVLKIRVRDVEKIIMFLGISIIAVYFISFVFYPRVIFRYSFFVELSHRGFRRIIPYGIGLLFFFSFYSINQYLIKRKLSWLIVYFVTLIFTVMSLTRTLIGVSFVLSALFIIRKISYLKKVIVATIIVLSFYLISQVSYFQIMIHETQETGQNLGNNIRVRAADYYLHEFSPNIFTKIFGNGEPSGNSHYGNFVVYELERRHRYFLSDIGYIGIYVTHGIFSVIALLILFLRVVRIKVPEQYLYAKYFLYFAFTVSFIIPVFIGYSYIPSIVFATYILAKKGEDQSNTLEKT